MRSTKRLFVNEQCAEIIGWVLLIQESVIIKYCQDSTESRGYVSIALNDDSKTRYPCCTAVSNVSIVVEFRLMLKEQLGVIIL